jgi:hypothetical protein
MFWITKKIIMNPHKMINIENCSRDRTTVLAILYNWAQKKLIYDIRFLEQY